MRHQKGFSRFLAALVLASVPAHATQPRIALRYERGQGAERCPDEHWFRRMVAVHLGVDPFVEDADATLHAHIERADQELVGRIELRDDAGAVEGKRELRSTDDDCTELSGAMVLAIAIVAAPHHLVGPSSSDTPGASGDEPTAQPAAAPEPRATEVSPPPPPPPIARSQPARASTQERRDAGPGARFLVSFGPDLSLGVSPNLEVGGAVGIRVVGSLWAVGLEGRATLPSEDEVGFGRVSSTSVLALLSTCVQYNGAGACILASGGALHLRANLANATSALHPVATFGGRLEYAIGKKSVKVRPFLDASTLLMHTHVTSGGQRIWSTSPVLVRAGAFLDLGLP